MIDTLPLWDDEATQPATTRGSEPAPWVDHHGNSGYRNGCRCTTCVVTQHGPVLHGLADYLDRHATR